MAKIRENYYFCCLLDKIQIDLNRIQKIQLNLVFLFDWVHFLTGTH